VPPPLLRPAPPRRRRHARRHATHGTCFKCFTFTNCSPFPAASKTLGLFSRGSRRLLKTMSASSLPRSALRFDVDAAGIAAAAASAMSAQKAALDAVGALA
jgi:hypothetical protein